MSPPRPASSSAASTGDAATPPDAAQDDSVEAWRMLLLAHAAAVRGIDHDVARHGLPLAWYDVLLELNAAEHGRLRMQELSGRVVLSRTRVSRLVDEMVADGLVRKQPDDEDRRSTWAVITADGRAALRRTAPHYAAGIEEHFTRHLSVTERRAVARALRKVVAAHADRQVPAPRLRRS